MRDWLVVLCGLWGCSFGPVTSSTPDAADAPPTLSSVHFTSVVATIDALRPGLYGFEITAVLQNDLDAPITNVAATLTFTDGTQPRTADFRWRDADRREGVTVGQPAMIAPGAQATYRFVVDALPWAVPPGPIEINGAAVFTAGNAINSATPLAQPALLPFAASNPTIVVTTALDELNADTKVSLREAITTALARPGLDRISFDPTTFPGGGTVIMLDEALGALPDITSDLVIDGHGAGVVLAITSAWETPEGRYGLHLTAGTLVVDGLTFRNFAFNYRNEGDLSTNNCGASNAQLEGGAIRVDGGTLILDGNRFSDVAVAERNCYAASLRIHGGSGHRIVDNTWTDQVMDSMFIDAATLEITGNVMNAGSTIDRVDECMFINSQGGRDLWVIGNVCVDQEYSGLAGNGTDAGTLYALHNVFARDGRVDLSGVRRSGGARRMVLRNNLYIADRPNAITADAAGAGFDIADETITGSSLCGTTCQAAVIDTLSLQTPTVPIVMNPSGVTLTGFTPLPGSPLIDTAVDWLDRNGSTPGHFNGAGPERGAVELP